MSYEEKPKYEIELPIKCSTMNNIVDKLYILWKWVSEILLYLFFIGIISLLFTTVAVACVSFYGIIFKLDPSSSIPLFTQWIIICNILGWSGFGIFLLFDCNIVKVKCKRG